jgi:hypothetical protein
MTRTHWHAVEISGHSATPEGPEEWEPSEDIYRNYREAFSVAFPHTPCATPEEAFAAMRRADHFVWSCTDPVCRERFGPAWWHVWPATLPGEVGLQAIAFLLLGRGFVADDRQWGYLGLTIGVVTWIVGLGWRLWRQHVDRAGHEVG